MSAIRTCELNEGRTTLVVPDQLAPAKYPSFFNPKGKFVRDVSVVCYQAYAESLRMERTNPDKLSFADVLCGTGARGLRVANELQKYFGRVFLNDVSPTSIDLAKKSAKENGVFEKCIFSQTEACDFLDSRSENGGERFDVVDLDPFGTPSPFVDCALRGTKHQGLLSISATDTAVLCGVYPHVALRKYLGLPLRTEYAHEVGLRLMFGLLSVTAMRFEAAIEPLFCHHDMHYFRAYCLVQIGNAFSRKNESDMGYALHCFKCNSRRMTSRQRFAEAPGEELKCPECGSIAKIGGPLWTGKLQSRDFVNKCAQFSKLSIFEDELDLPLYFDLSEVADSMQVRTPKIEDTIKELKSIGHSASRTRLNRTAVRTDAPPRELQAVLARLSR
jgi:tRNA (guanine26-N2/guanine27-N2)-dimethyltransferase